MRVILITFGVLITFFSYSQSIERQVIAGSGGFYTGGNHSMSFTLSEDVNLNATLKYSGPGNAPSCIIQNLVHLTGSTSITSVFQCPVPEGALK